MDTKKILEMVKSEISAFEFERYFGLIKFEENALRDDILNIIAPNIFIAEWIEINYIETLKNIAENINGVVPQINISVNKNPSGAKSIKTPKNNNISMINYGQTFENFVRGKSNEYAYTMCEIVAKNQGAYNPILIYGNTGVGKTHLLNAIANYATEKSKNVVYVTSQQFFKDYLTKIQNQNARIKFQEKYNKCDYLLIDDIQFFGGKPGVCDEFFQTFEELSKENKQIVMTSDKAPKTLQGFEDRMLSRFASGGIAQIENAELDTKIEIVKTKCRENYIDLDKEVIDFIATNIDDNRAINGIIMSINLQSNLNPNNPKIEIAKSVIKNHQKEKKENITIEQIIEIVANEINIKKSDITSKKRDRVVANARSIVMYLAKILTHNAMPEIAKALNMKDHSSVSKANKNLEARMAEDNDLKNFVENIKNKIKN